MVVRDEYRWPAEVRPAALPPTHVAPAAQLAPGLRRRASRLHLRLRREVTWLLDRNAESQARAFARAPGHDSEARAAVELLETRLVDGLAQRDRTLGDALVRLERRVAGAVARVAADAEGRAAYLSHQLDALDGAALDERDPGPAIVRVPGFLSSVGLPAPRVRVPSTAVESDVGRLLLPAHDKVVLPAVRGTGTWEPELGAWLRANVRPGDCVLNAGAHVGYHVLLLARCVGERGRVLAVEPEASVRRLLHANLWHHGLENVLVLPVAATDREQPVTLVVSSTNTGDNRVGSRSAEGRADVVPGLALDELLQDAPRLDLVLTDLQGHDQAALRGARRALARLRPRVVAEFWPAALRAAGEDPRAVLEEYRSWGYAISSLDADLAAVDAQDLAALVDAVDRRPARDTTLLLTPEP